MDLNFVNVPYNENKISGKLVLSNFSANVIFAAFTREAVTSLDSLVRTSCSDMVGSPLSDWSWLKASFPSSHRGLGLSIGLLYMPHVSSVV